MSIRKKKLNMHICTGVKSEIYVNAEKEDFPVSCLFISRVAQMAGSPDFYYLSSVFHLHMETKSRIVNFFW